MVERVMALGEAVQDENYPILIDRSGSVEEVFVSFSYAPIRDVRGKVVGVHNTGWDTTKIVVAERRMRLLRILAAQTAGANTPQETCELAAVALASDPDDIPFSLLYLLDEGHKQGMLAGTAGVEAGSAIAPRVINVSSEEVIWPLQHVLAQAPTQQDGVFRNHIADDFPNLSPSVSSALLMPLRTASGRPPIGVLVAAVNPHRPYDEGYRTFLDLVTQQINAGLAEARAKQLEHERHERLAELDRTKTEFFANVSHEFRTPLTLLLAPLEDLLRHRNELSSTVVQEVEIATNNSRRLLRLVNSLLDFSQIDSHRQQANFEPTDLCALTTDIASAFRSSIETAGLRFRVECDPRLQPVWIDREMWEKIVSNLLSNAFKFTFEGEIGVELHALSLHAELIVKDTGIGIPEQEMPNLFKRFHRIQGARSRTAEGSGIGLAIVDDLVKRVGGQLRARSKEGVGTEFTIWIPYKSSRIQGDPAATAAASETHEFATELARDASRWLLNTSDIPSEVMDELLDPPRANGEVQQGKILVVDDNADMRAYLQRLLRPRWEVELAADGASALQIALRSQPDAILADVMMPGLDGFELLKQIRANPALTHTPVIFLTARAGEEAAIQGLMAGADDYIAKPFSPRELVARIQAAVERARAEAKVAASEEKYRTLFESIDEGFCIIEVIFDANGKAFDLLHLEANDAYERYTGLRNIVGKRAREIVPDGGPWLDFYGNVALTGEPARLETYLAPGVDRWISSYASRVGGEGSRRVAVIFNDVTERRRREANLAFLAEVSQDLAQLTKVDETTATLSRKIGEFFKVSRVNFAVINEAADEAVITHEWHVQGLKDTSGERVYRLGTFISQEFYRLAHAGEMLVVRDTRTDPRTADAAYAEIDTRAFVTAPFVRHGEWQFLISIADSVPREWQDDEIELLREITNRIWWRLERARAEEVLRGSEERFRAFAMASSDAVYRMSPDWKEMRYLQGKGFLSDTEDTNVLWIEKYILKEDRPHVLHTIEKAIHNKGVFELEHRVIRADGTVGWTFSRAVPLLDEHGEIMEWLGTARDLTERVHIQEKPRRSNGKVKK